jgi:hypothetical protein
MIKKSQDNKKSDTANNANFIGGNFTFRLSLKRSNRTENIPLAYCQTRKYGLT